MSFASFNRAGAALGPEAVAAVQAVFERVCDEYDESKCSDVAQQTAAVLIRSFQRGIQDPEILADIGRAVMRQPVTSTALSTRSTEC
ncbi:hypothetical protein GOZ89_24140 [Agrobacterium vitis]|uniref:hypothetical protein n=1 Tax=Agrobacterium vitis TaxID=373 RepID=UPI0012E94701|nr:hypothetical protein [Agrobacterium vitis]MVA38029.1 hypothetical protein [Agrobacterium vitis]MVA82502.1 hypothetical protein [Agrobacterium vitis]